MNCNECRIGHYRSTRATYNDELEGQMITVPDAPAFVCDVCGHMFFEPHFVQRIDVVLSEFEAMGPPVKVKAKRPSTGPISPTYPSASSRRGSQ